MNSTSTRAGNKATALIASLAMAVCLSWAVACACASSAFADDTMPNAAPLQTQGIQAQAVDYDITWYTSNPDASEFTLTTVAQLKGFAKLVNGTVDAGVAGKPDSAVSFEGKVVKLGASLNLAGQAIDPIGTKDHPFQGTFDGQRTSVPNVSGQSIVAQAVVRAQEAAGCGLHNYKLVVGNTGADITYKGLFGYAGDQASIKNLLLEGTLDDGSVKITNTTNGKKIEHVGAIAGHLGGSIENCKSTADVSVTNNGAVPAKQGEKPEELCTVLYVGGLVGSLGGDMTNCVHGNNGVGIDQDATLYIASNQGVTDNVPYIAGYVGGLAGLQGDESDGSKTMVTSNCQNYGALVFNVNGTAKADRFGNKTYAKSAVVGGIVGYSMASFANCTNSATINTGIMKGGDPLDANDTPLDAYGASNTGGIVGSLRGPAIASPMSSTGVVGSDPTDPGYDVWTNSEGATEPPTLTVEKCMNTGYVVGLASVGGMVGNGGAFTRIVGCVNEGQIDGTRSTKPCPGGIAGITNGDIAYCASKGRVRTSTTSGYYASGIVGLLSTYNTSSTKLALIMDAPEIYGCYISAFVVSSNSGDGYRSAVITGESDGYIHDNCFLPGLTTNKAVPKDWQKLIDVLGDDLSVPAADQADFQAMLDRVNVLENKSFSLTGGKLAGGTKAQLETACTRSAIIDPDHDRGTTARNWELTADELKSSMGVACLNRNVGVAGDWSESAYFYQRAANVASFPVLNWQGLGVSGTTDLSTATGLQVAVAANPQYSAAYTPVPTLDVTLGGAKLYQNADYVVLPQAGATAVGTGYQASIRGINAYTGTRDNVATYAVVQCDLDNCTVAATSKTFNWEAQKPEKVTLIDDAGVAHAVDATDDGDSDFVWSLPDVPAGADTTGAKKFTDGKYYDYTNVHSATYQYDIVVKVKDSKAATSSYTGSTQQPAFHINWVQLIYGEKSSESKEPYPVFDKVVYGGQSWDYLQAAKTKGLVKIKYTGKAIEPKIANPTFLGRPLRDGTGQQYWNAPLDYDYRYVYGNPNPDPSNVKSFDCVNVTGSKEANLACMAIRFTPGGNFDNYSNVFFEITPASLASDVSVQGAGGSYLYTGSEVRPLTLTYNGMTLEEGRDYTASYSNNVDLGVASVTFAGKGNYTGTTSAQFTIYDTAERASSLNTAAVSADQIRHAAAVGAKSVTLGPVVKTVAASAFAGTPIKTIVVTTKKLTKKSIKNALKGSKVKTVKVQVQQLKSTKGLKGKALKAAKKYNKKAKKTNAKYVKKYKKIFTKKICGAKVKVK